MSKLRLYVGENLLEELEIQLIDYQLNNILKSVSHFSSPGNSPTREHKKDLETGYLKAGSEVFVQPVYSENYMDNSLSKDYVTYTFQVAWDKNFSKHDTDKHWNLKIFKSIHFRDGKPRKDYYDISGFKNVNHLKCNKIKLELLDDDGIVLVSREFSNENNEEKEIKVVDGNLK